MKYQDPEIERLVKLNDLLLELSENYKKQASLIGRLVTAVISRIKERCDHLGIDYPQRD